MSYTKISPNLCGNILVHLSYFAADQYSEIGFSLPLKIRQPRQQKTWKTIFVISILLQSSNTHSRSLEARPFFFLAIAAIFTSQGTKAFFNFKFVLQPIFHRLLLLLMVMTTMVSEHACVRTAHEIASSVNSKWQPSIVRKKPHTQLLLYSSRIRACHSMANKKEVYKQVGLFQNAVFVCR